MEKELDVLYEFLSYPLNDESAIMSRFASLPGAVHRKGENQWEEFVFVKGSRADAATLVAHADTVFDIGLHDFETTDNIIRSTTFGTGLGADDRAGLAILWLLRDSGHNLLITNGEERGQIGAHYLMDSCPDIVEAINASSFLIQFDRRNRDDYKFYDLPVSLKFKEYIKEKTKYKDAGSGSSTDIATLCNPDFGGCVCGVNLSIGYRYEHTEDETLNINDWFSTYNKAKAMLSKPLNRYPLAV